MTIVLYTESRGKQKVYQCESLIDAVNKAQKVADIFFEGIMINAEPGDFEMERCKIIGDVLEYPYLIVDKNIGEVVYYASIYKVEGFPSKECVAIKKEERPKNPWKLVRETEEIKVWESTKYEGVRIFMDKPNYKFTIADLTKHINYADDKRYGNDFIFDEFEEADDAVEGIYGDRPETE